MIVSVKVDVHSNSSGAGSDENLSSSDLSERSGGHEHDYEDIYLVRNESKDKALNSHQIPTLPTKDRPTNGIRSRSRDSGSHSRSGSASSNNSCNAIIKITNNNDTIKSTSSSTLSSKKILPKPQKYEKQPVKRTTNVHGNGTNGGEEKQLSQESGMSSASPSDLGHSEEEAEKHKLAGRHSLPPQNSKVTHFVPTCSKYYFNCY